MEVRRDPRQFVFIIVLLLLLNSPDQQGPGLNAHTHYHEVIDREWVQLETLNTTKYGDFDAQNNKWVNITGLRKEDAFTWDALEGVKGRARERMRGVLGEKAQGWLDGKNEGHKETVYRNISGFVDGEWVRSPLSRMRYPLDLLNATGEIPDYAMVGEFDRNLTGTHGTVRLHLTEVDGRQRTDENRTISELRAKVTIGDSDSWGDNWWEFNLNGVHYPDFGGVVLATTSERFGGVFALPHLQLSSHLHSVSQKLLNRTIHETIDRQLERPFPVWNPWSSAIEGAAEGILTAHHCEFVLFLQEAPVQFQTKRNQQPLNGETEVDWIEEELRHPTGARLPLHSSMAMSMVGFSPDCGFVIESKGPPDFSPSEALHLVGSKTEEYNDQARQSILGFALVLAFQLYFTVKQAKESATPSTRNRISFYTIGIMALGDGFVFISLIFMPLFLGTSQLAIYGTAFLAFITVIVDLRFLMDIYTVQVTEQLRQDRQQSSSQPSPQPPATPNPPSTQGASLPVPTTTPRPPQPSPPIIIPSDQDSPTLPTTNPTTTPPQPQTGPTRADLSALYTRYCFLLLLLFFLTLHITTTLRTTARTIYLTLLSLVHLSPLLPQLARNALRNSRHALRWDFALASALSRLAPVAYFFGVETNILFSGTDGRILLALVGWVWMQLVWLAAQEVFGARFCVRESWSWVPEAWEYHPVLREDVEGAMLPVGADGGGGGAGKDSDADAARGAGKGMRVFDCSICAGDIVVPVVSSGGGGEAAGSGSGSSSTDVAQSGGSLMLARRAYMVTPCRHIFHTACLEGWLRYRLVCPNCREGLPPL